MDAQSHRVVQFNPPKPTPLEVPGRVWITLKANTRASVALMTSRLISQIDQYGGSATISRPCGGRTGLFYALGTVDLPETGE
jgi:hypothetical protein